MESMKKSQQREFDPQLLSSIDPEKREEFKTVVRKRRYIASGIFFFIWHANLYYLSLPLVWFIHFLMPPYARLMNHLFSDLSYLLESFFLMIILGIITRPLRNSLNQRGLHASHLFFVVFPILMALYYWIQWWPERGH
jgi:hypothetical protein